MKRSLPWAALLACAAAALSPARAAQDDPGRSASWLQRRLETGMSEALGGTVRIGRMDVDWTALAATVEDVSIEIPAGSAPPLAVKLARGRVRLSWSGLTGIGGGSIHITELAASGASFACSREWIESWRPKAKKGGAVEIRIDRLTVDDGAAVYSDAGQRVSVAATGLTFRGDWSTSRRLLVGEVRASAAVSAPIFGRPWPATVRGGLRLGAGRLEIFGGEAEGPGATAELSGNALWGAGVSFTAEGRADADLGTIAPFLASHLRVSGSLAGPVRIVYTGGTPLRLTMQAATTALHIGPIVTQSATGDVTLRPGRLDVARLDGRGYGGRFAGSVGLAFGNPMTLETDLTGQGADLARLIALAGKELPVASDADVTLKIVGDPGRPATWTGGGTFDATPRAAAPGRFPARGRGELTFASGRVRVTSERLEMASAVWRLDLESNLLATPPTVRMTLDGTTRGARETQLAALAFMRALGVGEPKFSTDPIEGTGRVRAVVATGPRTRVELSLDLANGSWSGEPFETAVLDLGVDDATVELRRLDVTRGGESVSARLRFDGHDGELGAIDVHGQSVSIATLLAKAGIAVPVEGRLDLTLRGERDAYGLAAQGHATARNVRVGREVFDSIEADVVIEGDLVVLQGVDVRAPGLEAQGRVYYHIASQEADVEIDRASVDVASNRSLAEAGLAAQGTVEARGAVIVTKEGPSGQLTVAASRLFVDTGRTGVRELQLGDLSGTLGLSPRGLEIAVRADPDVAWTFDAFLGWSDRLPISAVLYFDDLVVGAGGAFGESVDLRLKGQVQGEGELTDLRAMEVNGAFDEVEVRLGPRTLRAVEPFPLRVESGRFTFGPTRFEGDDAHLELSGDGSIEGGPIRGRMEGALDLSIVSAIASDVRGSGPISIDVTLAGTLDSPSLSGRIGVRDGRLRMLGYPQSLESIEAEAVFEESEIRLESFHAYQGGGEITASGRAVVEKFSLASFRAVIDGVNVTATFPAGFKGTYQGHLTVDGTPKATTIAGRIDVVRGLYSKDFDLNVLGTARREFEAEAESPLPRNLFLNVDVVAPGNVWLRNDVAKLEASGELHIGGELARPEVTGRLSLFPGGNVRFRNVDYTIEYGTLDLTDRKRINPYLDLRGKTRVEQYDIALHIEGTLDKFDYELTSTPPLASQDIISLLVTGKTLESLSGSASAAALPGDMAAYYFAGLLSSTFGKQIQSTLGIDQLEITPLLLKGETDPTARVSIGKRVGDEVKIIFSQDIGTAQKQTYQVVWDASRQFRIVAESDTDTGLGGEVQYTRRFGGTPVGSSDAAEAARAGTAGDLPGTIGAVTVRTEGGEERKDLAKRVKLRRGEPFDRGKMLAESDRIRARLVEDGYAQAIVRTEASRHEEDGGTYDLLYKVIPGPRITLELVTADGKGERRLRKAARAFWRDTPYTPDLWDETTQALLEAMQEAGYYAADATWSAIDTPAGRTIRIRVDRGKAVRLRAIRFSGVASIPRDRIDKQVTSLQNRALHKRVLRPAILTEDLAAVRALYRDEGFARVRIGQPRVTLAATGDAAEVDVEVQEGPRFTVGDVTFSEDLPARPEELAAWAGLKSGDVFSPRRLSEAEQALREKFDARGYPDVNVESSVELSSDTADVAFRVEPGTRKTIGEIALEGNRVTRDRTIARSLTFGRGDLVSRGALLTSQQRLYRSGLFSSVRLSYAPLDPADPTEQKVTVKVEEAPPLTFGVGVGYDSEDGPRLSVLLAYSNVAGRNIGLAFQGLVSPNDERAQISARRRRVFGRTIDSLATLLYEKSVEEGFTQMRRALSFRLEQRPRPRWIRYIRYNIEEVRISDILDQQATLEQIFEDKLSATRLGSLGVGLVRDTRDDAFVTTRGGYASLEGSIFAEPLASESSFVKLFLRGSWTHGFKRGSRFATFLRIGAEQPFAGTELVPLSERFFAGGSSTMRGFEMDTVGGLKVGDFNAGGEGLLILNEEWSFPLWRSLRGELFFDAGNVYPRLRDFDATDLRYSSGVGFRLDTPIGAIRAEYGWKLDRKEGESPGEFVFAIGAVF